MPPRHRLLILYASQTGYAQETAERIEREAKQRHFNVELRSMHEYDILLLPNERLVAFVCSVTGQGEEPDKMKVQFTKSVFLEVFVEEIAAKIIDTITVWSIWTGRFVVCKIQFPCQEVT
jgi:sulfite reductase alpha subunit-like flavoprotein